MGLPSNGTAALLVWCGKLDVCRRLDFPDGSQAAHRFRVPTLPLARRYVQKGEYLTQDESMALLVEATVAEQATKKGANYAKEGSDKNAKSGPA